MGVNQSKGVDLSFYKVLIHQIYSTHGKNDEGIKDKKDK